MNKRFEALDAFRGLCAVCVVIYHIVLVGSFSQWSLFRNSYIFVEFFFVLSGFVLAHGYGFKKGVSFNSFVKGRIIRIYPLHLFMLLVFVGLELLNLLAYNYGFSFRGEPFSGKTSISELIINIFLLQSWIPSAEALSFNGPSWSISVEFYMYILLFITATFLKGIRFSWLLISLFSFLLLSISQDLMTKESLRGLSCFFGGAFTYTVFKKFNDLSFNFKFGSVIEAFLIAIVLLGVCVEFTYRDFALPVIFMIVVLFFSYESGVISIVLKSGFLQRIGTLSFSIYMTHYFIIICVKSFLTVINKFTENDLIYSLDGSKIINLGNPFFNNFLLIFVIMITLIISNLTYKYVELGGKRLAERYGP